MRPFARAEILERLAATRKRREPIVLGGAGIGLVAKAADRAGIDILMAYNTGPFRMDGHGSLAGYLAYGDANAITLELARKILPVVENTPVVGGIGAADPYRDVGLLIDEFVRAGFSGITNVPTAGLYDGTFRRQYAERIGAEESSLREHAILDPAATVRRDVERLRSAPSISPRVNVSGHVYDVVTGLVETILPVRP